jgi:hypothetical protein
MSRSWRYAADDAAVVEPRAVRKDVRRRATHRAVRRRRAVAFASVVFVVFVVVAAVLLAGSSSARDGDPFTGTWWEPDSGRRVEILRKDEAFTFLYGAERRPFVAEQRGDTLVIAAPLGGDIVVRHAGDDRLELVDGGRTTTLQPAPDGS